MRNTREGGAMTAERKSCFFVQPNRVAALPKDGSLLQKTKAANPWKLRGCLGALGVILNIGISPRNGWIQWI